MLPFPSPLLMGGKRTEVTAWRYPATATQTSGSPSNWSDLANVLEDAGNWAQAAVTDIVDTEQIIVYDFGFSIPPTAIVTKAEVQVDRRGLAEGVSEIAAAFYRDAAAGTGVLEVTQGDWPTSFATTIYEAEAASAFDFGPVDVSLINGSAWGFRLAAGATLSTQAQVNYIRARITYQV